MEGEKDEDRDVLEFPLGREKTSSSSSPRLHEASGASISLKRLSCLMSLAWRRPSKSRESSVFSSTSLSSPSPSPPTHPTRLEAILERATNFEYLLCVSSASSTSSNSKSPRSDSESDESDEESCSGNLHRDTTVALDPHSLSYSWCSTADCGCAWGRRHASASGVKTDDASSTSE